MQGYKGMPDDMTCRGFKYEVGKTYETNEPIDLCRCGFHFCKNLVNVFGYYDRDDGNRFFEVEAENKSEYTLDPIGAVAISRNKVLFIIPCEW